MNLICLKATIFIDRQKKVLALLIPWKQFAIPEYYSGIANCFHGIFNNCNLHGRIR